jgi:hypothetical protein
MPYLTPFPIAVDSIGLGSPPFDGEQRIPVSALLTLLRTVIRAVPVDEEWYCRVYPDVAEAINAGDVESATQHFVENGYFEGRSPSEPKVDEKWYLETNPDVVAGIKDGTFESAQEHFDSHGYLEGRMPSAM